MTVDLQIQEEQRARWAKWVELAFFVILALIVVPPALVLFTSEVSAQDNSGFEGERVSQLVRYNSGDGLQAVILLVHNQSSESSIVYSDGVRTVSVAVDSYDGATLVEYDHIALGPKGWGNSTVNVVLTASGSGHYLDLTLSIGETLQVKSLKSNKASNNNDSINLRALTEHLISGVYSIQPQSDIPIDTESFDDGSHVTVISFENYADFLSSLKHDNDGVPSITTTEGLTAIWAGRRAMLNTNCVSYSHNFSVDLPSQGTEYVGAVQYKCMDYGVNFSVMITTTGEVTINTSAEVLIDDVISPTFVTLSRPEEWAIGESTYPGLTVDNNQKVFVLYDTEGHGQPWLVNVDGTSYEWVQLDNLGCPDFASPILGAYSDAAVVCLNGGGTQSITWLGNVLR